MKEVIEFLKNNKDVYSEYFINDRLKKCVYGYTCDINQIYCYLKLVNIKDSEYYKFYLLSKKYFDFPNQKILEVGCGYIPILSSIYKQKGINIDAINKKIVINKYKNVNTTEYDLTRDYDFSNYNLIIGFRPCNITENVLNLCNKYHKNFMIYLCPCIHKPANSSVNFNTYNEWVKYLLDKIKKFRNYNIQIIKKHNLPDNCPILIGQYTDIN